MLIISSLKSLKLAYEHIKRPKIFFRLWRAFVLRADHPPWTFSLKVALFWASSYNFFKIVNPLTTIGSPVTHENWPMNWPNFAASPALLGWPARNRQTAACIHRFSHLLRTPPVPVVWIMSESRAVANEHEGHKRTIPIISSSFWMTVVLKGLYNAIFYSLYNPLTTIGSPVTHENWPMNWPNFAASPALLGWPARNRHTAACIHRFSHLLRTPPVPVVWIMSESRAVANEHEGHKRTIPIISSSFWMTVVLKGLTISILLLTINYMLFLLKLIICWLFLLSWDPISRSDYKTKWKFKFTIR